MRKNNLPSLETAEGDWKAVADLELDQRDRDLGREKGAPLGASGWRGSDINYRDIDELTPSELRQIEDINTAEEALEQLERIVQRRLYEGDGNSSSLIDRSTISNFKKSIAKDDRELRLLNARLEFRNEKDDKEKEECGQEYISLKCNGNPVKLVYRNAKRVQMKRSKSTLNPVSGILRPSSKVSAPSTHYVDRTFGDDAVLFQNSDCILSSVPLSNDKSYTVAVVSLLAKQLKSHQIQGIKFMWKNTFDDLTSLTSRCAETVKGGFNREVRGCILGECICNMPFHLNIRRY
jgi:hypothetical protein